MKVMRSYVRPDFIVTFFYILDCVKLKKNLSWHQNEIPAKNYHQREIHFNMYPVRQANIIKISMQSLKLTGRQPKMTVQLAMWDCPEKPHQSRWNRYWWNKVHKVIKVWIKLTSQPLPIYRPVGPFQMKIILRSIIIVKRYSMNSFKTRNIQQESIRQRAIIFIQTIESQRIDKQRFCQIQKAMKLFLLSISPL